MRIAQTPAPKKDRIYGSKLNKPNSASSKSKAKSIKLNESVITSIKSIIEGTGISLATAKAVVRRGMGAYSKSHRPTIKGGKPNSRVAWGLARLNAFVYKAEHGKSKSGKYTQDDDLLRESGFRVSKMGDGGKVDIAEWQTEEPELFKCLLTVRSLVEANATVKDSFIDTHNNLYVIEYEDSNPYFDGIITETCKTLTECENYLEVGEVEVTDKFVLVPLANNTDIGYEDGGKINKELYSKWEKLVNMSASELKQFMATKDGKEAGLTKGEADELGIKSGHESAKWILKMKATNVNKWTPKMWEWAKRQVSFISRMRGNKGGLYDKDGNKTRKHTSLLIWGHNPMKFNGGGMINEDSSIYEIATDIERDHQDTYNKIKLAEKYLASGNLKLAKKILLGDNKEQLLNHFEEEKKYLFPKINNRSNARAINTLLIQHEEFKKLFEIADSQTTNVIIAQLIVLLKYHMTLEYELIQDFI